MRLSLPKGHEDETESVKDKSQSPVTTDVTSDYWWHQGDIFNHCHTMKQGVTRTPGHTHTAFTVEERGKCSRNRVGEARLRRGSVNNSPDPASYLPAPHLRQSLRPGRGLHGWVGRKVVG